MNSRFRIWLKSVGKTEQDYEEARQVADQQGSQPVFNIDGKVIIIGLAYIEWSKAQWAEWAHHLGFHYNNNGVMAHHAAIMAGYPSSDHHRWLADKYGVDFEYEPVHSPTGDFR